MEKLIKGLLYLYPPLPTYPHTCELWGIIGKWQRVFFNIYTASSKNGLWKCLRHCCCYWCLPYFHPVVCVVSSTFSFCTIISDCSLEGLQKLVTMQICILKVEWSSTYFDLIVILLKQIIVFMYRGGPSSQRAAAFVQRNPGYDLFAPWVLYSSVPQVVTHKFRGGKLRVGDLGVLIH